MIQGTGKIVSMVFDARSGNILIATEYALYVWNGQTVSLVLEVQP